MFYGVHEAWPSPANSVDLAVEAVAVRGWAVLPGLVSQAEAANLASEVESAYEAQLQELGNPDLASIRDANLARGLALYSAPALRLAVSNGILTLVEAIMRSPFILYTQNGVINPPDQGHEQRKWHRDLNYQHWVSDRPLGVSVLVALDDFTIESGGTQFLSGTHKVAEAPSADFAEKYAESADVVKGDCVVFNSMTFHRAGANVGSAPRRAINHVFTTPIISQQTAFYRHLAEARDADGLNGEQLDVLGRIVGRPQHPRDWRQQRLAAAERREG